MEVLPKNFEVGKVYKSKGGITWVRLNEGSLLYLSNSSGAKIFFPVDSKFIQIYHEIFLNDLTSSQLKTYHEYFSKEEAKEDTCTCDSKDLFWYGCKCGWAKKK